MKTPNFILALCLIVSLSGNAQNNEINLDYDCDTMNLNDSLFCKAYVTTAIDDFKDRFNLDVIVLTFNQDHLNSMYDLYQNTTNVRIYLTLPTNEMALPGAVLVPVLQKDCKKDVEGMVLEATRIREEGYVGPITPEIKAEMSNWKSTADKLPGLTPVYGYNFTWQHIMEACDDGDEKLGIIFGISDVDNQSEGEEIHIYLTEGVPNMENRLFMDFSSPCPKMCGDLMIEE